jgi:hypothetical protein
MFIATVQHAGAEQPNRDTTKYVRRNWIAFAAYYAAASLAAGLCIAGSMFLFAVLGLSKHERPMPVHEALTCLLVFLVGVSVVAFLIQLISGPFVLTKDAVCKKCRTRLKLNRIDFFRGRYARSSRCGCGGGIEPALLWKPQDRCRFDTVGR